MDDEAILAHLRGRHVLGAYPLCADDTCWFCAIDLDGTGWDDDVVAIRASARELGVPVAVERSRAWIRSQLNVALRRAGLWEKLERGVRVEEFTHRGDRFRFDFGYRRNGHRGFLHTLALEREVDRAKVLAYTMERIRTRLAAQKLTAACTAIVEGKPENETAELSARILAEQEIALVPVAELPEFATRLRQQLA